MNEKVITLRTPLTEPRIAIGVAPAKLILFGEHSVVAAQPALGLALSRGVRVSLTRGKGGVRTEMPPGFGLFALESAGATPRALIHAALGARAETLDAHIVLSVPPLAGLGTSAALAVAALRALQAMDDAVGPADELLESATRIEGHAHGTSSGLDPAICLFGGLIAFQHREGRPEIRRVALESSFHLVVGVRGCHGGTGERQRTIAATRARLSGPYTAAMQALGETARAGIDALSRADLVLAGRTLDLAHGILSGLGLVGDEIERLCRLARTCGALGAKMSGAGGPGGAFFALAPDIATANRIRDRLLGEGALAWIETAA